MKETDIKKSDDTYMQHRNIQKPGDAEVKEKQSRKLGRRR